jgi:hypothetical protein
MLGRGLRSLFWFGLSLLIAFPPIDLALAGDTPNGYHWARKQTQFTLEIGDNVSGDWDSLLKQAISEWSDSGTVTMREIKGSTDPQKCAPTDGIVEVCNGDYGTQKGWLGLTQLYFDNSGDHIESVTVQWNDSFFNQSGGQYNDPAARQHTACHELGHSTGLGHANTDSCMNDSQNAVFHNLKPINKDFQTLAQTYAHQDSTVTVAGPQKKPKNDKGDKKKHHKHKKHDGKSGKGRAENDGFFSPTSLPAVPSGLTEGDTEMVQTLDNGQKVVSFITWAGQ